MLHILPKEKMPVSRLPLDLHVANRIAYQRKLEREGRSLVDRKAQQEGKVLT